MLEDCTLIGSQNTMLRRKTDYGKKKRKGGRKETDVL